MITLNTQGHLKEDLLILSRCFTFFIPSFSFLLTLFRHHVYNIQCILYNYSFCYVMYYLMSEMCVEVLRGLFLLLFPTSAIANESLIPYNLKKEHQEHRTFNTITPNAYPNQIKKKCKMQLKF